MKAPSITTATLVGDRKKEWRFVTRDLRKIRHRMGTELLGSFARCFVHCDRLVSLTHLGTLGLRSSGETAWSQRNLLTIVWFSLGTLRELASAARILRGQLVKKALVQKTDPRLFRLRQLERKWEANPLYLRLRNKGAFHVDGDTLNEGVELLSKSCSEVTLARGSGPSDYESSSNFGSDALVAGLSLSDEEVARLLRDVYADMKIYLVFDQLFFAALMGIGVRVVDRRDNPLPGRVDRTIQAPHGRQSSRTY